MLPSFQRGDVILVNLDPAKGAEVKGTRPCIVVQNDIANARSPSTVVVPVTDAVGKKPYPFQVFLPKGEGGLRKDSLAKCQQIRTISRARIVDKWGTISNRYLKQIGEAIKRHLDLS